MAIMGITRLNSDSERIPEWEYAKQRSFPSLYVVDGLLNVVLHVPGDRIPASIPAYAHDGKLPEPLRETVRSIVATLTPERQTGLEISAENAMLVRVARESGPNGNMAVFVHEYKTRDGIKQFVAQYGITPREHEVLIMLIDGHSTTAMAERINVAVSTVLLHIKSLLVKTRSHSRTELVGKVVLHEGRSAILRGTREPGDATYRT